MLALSETELKKTMQQHTAMADAARRCLVTELVELAEQRADDVLLDLPARIAKTLLRLAGASDTLVTVIDVSQQLVAELSRGSRQSVNQALKHFVSRGWLHMEKGRIVILDPAALGRRAGASAR